MDRDNGVRMDCGVAGWAGGRRGKGKKWDNCSRINKNLKKINRPIGAIFKNIVFKSKF